MAELISLYGVDRRPRRLEYGNMIRLTRRQMKMYNNAERLGFIPIDSIIQGATAITTSVVNAVSAKAQQERDAANTKALQQQADLAQARQVAALQSQSGGVVTTTATGQKAISLQTALTIGIPVALFGLTMFLKSRKRK